MAASHNERVVAVSNAVELVGCIAAFYDGKRQVHSRGEATPKRREQAENYRKNNSGRHLLYTTNTCDRCQGERVSGISCYFFGAFGHKGVEAWPMISN